MLLIAIAATFMSGAVAAPQGTAISQDSPVKIKTVALLPWSMAAATDGGREMTTKAIDAVFAKANYHVLPIIGTKKVWEEDLLQPHLDLAPQRENDLRPLPNPKELLVLGQKLNADLVCAGRAKWHTKSVWVSLGPKTKADCTVDVILIDVAKKEIILEATGVKCDSTRKEAGLETAGALLLTMGITALSGGPKDPHHRRAGVMAVGMAFDPWMKTMAPSNKKIGG